jgi:hypothetical protein
VWRSSNGGQTWDLELQAAASWPSAFVSLTSRNFDEALVAISSTVWQFASGKWQRVLELDRPIMRLIRPPGQKGVFVLTSRQVLHSANGLDWCSLEEGLASETLMDVALLSPDREELSMCVLSQGGKLWHKKLTEIP